MNLLRSIFLHNAGLKLLSLVIASLLWSTYTSEPRVEIGFEVPVEFTHLADNIEIGPDVPLRVHVRLRGRPIVLRRLIPADITVRVDLAGMGAGQMIYRPAADQLELPLGVELVSITPKELRIPLQLRTP